MGILVGFSVDDTVVHMVTYTHTNIYIYDYIYVYNYIFTQTRAHTHTHTDTLITFGGQIMVTGQMVVT